jgi:formylglycine-generating enzyme required for sulfatase activity
MDAGCNGYRPYDRSWGRDDRPVINVNWDEANAYAEWLSRKTGKTYRLLSEAEREYVTGAGTITPYWWGTKITPEQANYDGHTYFLGFRIARFRKQTVPVGSFEPNPWGLYNVHGNVWEWTADCSNENDKGNPGNGSARTTSTSCVIRGGSWLADSQYLRSDRSLTPTSDIRSDDLGFRLARTLNP